MKKFSLAFQNISNFVKINYHMNIILVNVPYRYDVMSSTTVNREIETFNRKLKKVVKIFPHASFLDTTIIENYSLSVDSILMD